MKSFFLLLAFILASVKIVHSQDYIIAQEGTKDIFIYEIPSEKWLHLDSADNGKLLGCKLYAEKLTCYFSLNGKIFEKEYVNQLFLLVGRKPEGFTMITDGAFEPVKFKCGEYLFFLRSTSYSLYKNNKHLLGVDSISIMKYPSKMEYLIGYAHPDISIHKSSILIERHDTHLMAPSKCFIYEIDVLSGKMIKIGRGDMPLYSPTGNYILCQNDIYKDVYYIYDWKTKKKMKWQENDISNANAMFWLYKE